jgi:probable addiction module antidote protein
VEKRPAKAGRFVGGMTDQIMESGSREEIVERINTALAASDLGAICQLIGDAVKLNKVSEIARKAGLERSSIYRAFAGQQSPNFSTVLSVLDAMGLRLKVMPRRARQRIRQKQSVK